MKVAIDAGITLSGGHEVRGVGVHTRELLSELKQLAGREDINIRTFKEGESWVDYDLVHFTHFRPFFKTLPSTLPKKFVVTVHDLTPLIYPKAYPPGVTGKLNYLYQKRRIRHAAAIITISETSKKDICRFLNYSPERVHVIYLAARSVLRPISTQKLSRIAKKYGLPDSFILYVGDVNYNKNIPVLIEASTLANIPLVICGKHALEIDDFALTLENLHGPMDWYRYLFNKPHPELAHYLSVTKLLRENGNVIRTGFVPDEDLAAIYNLATVFCFPPLYEGFGLGVIEAMACGTPVVASKTQALVEVGGDAALYADPKSPRAFAAEIKRISNNKTLARELSKKGLARASQFSWKKAAKETLDVYRSVVGND